MSIDPTLPPPPAVRPAIRDKPAPNQRGPEQLGPGHPAEAEAREVLKAIRRIIRAVDVHSKHVGRASGLTVPQLVVLQAIRDLGEATTGTLSRHASVSQATVTTILDNLESRGLVRRDRSTRDRRIVHPKLTEEGQAVLASAPPVLKGAFTEAFAALAPETRRSLVVSFEMVATLMEVAGPAPALEAQPLNSAAPASPNRNQSSP